jgi:Dolichyl-phosphate-mannose-protein mannosyltransferase
VSTSIESLALRQPPQAEPAVRDAAVGRRSRRVARLIVLAALTLIAGWLRVRATGFGLPDKFRPDEEYMVSRALGFENDWNPHFALYPAAQMYVQHAALKYYAALIGERVNFRAAYATNGQALAYLVARRVSVLFGAATVPAIYFAGAAAFGPDAAIAAAAIATFATLHVRESKYATTDAAAVFWLTLAIAMVLRIARRGRSVDYLGAGFFAGLATATKYPAGAVVFAVAAAHLGVSRRERRSLWQTIGDPGIYLAGLTAAVTFFCATPYMVLDWAQTVNDFTYQKGFLLNGVGNRLADWGWSWLALRAMPDGFGVALQVFLLAAMVWVLFRPRPGTLSLLTFIAVAMVGMTRSHYVFYRYLMIPFPAMALLGGVMAADLKRLAAARLGDRRAAALAAIGLGLLIAPSLVRDIQLNRLLMRTDTRTLARQWIESHVPPGGAIAATDNTTPYGKPQLYTVRVLPFADPRTLRQEGVQYVMSDSLAPLAFYSRGPTPAEMAELNSDAVLVFDADPFKPGSPTPVFDAADAFYAPLRHITSMTRPGPRIRIWRLK